MMDIVSSFRLVRKGLTLAVLSGLTLASLPSVEVSAMQTSATVVYVSNSYEFQLALNHARPGTKILLKKGTYIGGLSAENLHGTAILPIVIAPADPAEIPVIRISTIGLQLSSCSYLHLYDLSFSGSEIALNIDDGGTYGTSHHIVLSGLKLRNTYLNSLKMAGVDNFQITNMHIQGYATTASCGMDLVGCHNGTITGCTIANNSDAVGYGIQMKGGCTDIVVSKSTLIHCGARGFQIGGSTGVPYFRPAFHGYEAKDITIENNVVIGSQSAVSFASVDGAIVNNNTFYRQTAWVFRILQEDTYAGYIPSRNGVTTNNIIVFRSTDLHQAVNVGILTAPETFQWGGNWWYCLDKPSRSVPILPTPEVNGTYGVDPLFMNAPANLHLQPGSLASGKGAYAH